MSTNRLLSKDSLVTVDRGRGLSFWPPRRVAPRLPLLALDICLGIASINAVFVTAQEYLGWNPFYFPPEARRAHQQHGPWSEIPMDVGVVPGRPTDRGDRRGLWPFRAGGGFSMQPPRSCWAAGLAAKRYAGPLSLPFSAGVIVMALLRPIRQALVDPGDHRPRAS